MRTNIEKWNYYLSILNNRTKNFIDSNIDITIPNIFYITHNNGKIDECETIEIEYLHSRHGFKSYIGKNPTKKDIERIIEYSTNDIPFSIEYIYIKYIYLNNSEITKSSIKFSDLKTSSNLFKNRFDAEYKSSEILNEIKIHNNNISKYLNYTDDDYISDGFKFLGWINSWSNINSLEDHSDYYDCIKSKHDIINIRIGKIEISCCPICKIYWKCGI